MSGCPGENALLRVVNTFTASPQSLRLLTGRPTKLGQPKEPRRLVRGRCGRPRYALDRGVASRQRLRPLLTPGCTIRNSAICAASTANYKKCNRVGYAGGYLLVVNLLVSFIGYFLQKTDSMVIFPASFCCAKHALSVAARPAVDDFMQIKQKV